MKTRRTFLKSGLIWIPFAPIIARSQVELSFLATKPVAVGAACNTQKDASSTPSDGFDGVSLGTVGRLWTAHYFLSASSYTMCKFDIQLRKVGSPTGNITPHIFGTTSNLPATNLGTGTVLDRSTIGGTYSTITFSGFSVSITTGTVYWLVLQQPTEVA